MGMVNNGIVIPPSQCLEMMGLILTPDKSLVNYSVIYTDAIKSTILKDTTRYVLCIQLRVY